MLYKATSKLKNKKSKRKRNATITNLKKYYNYYLIITTNFSTLAPYAYNTYKNSKRECYIYTKIK